LPGYLDMCVPLDYRAAQAKSSAESSSAALAHQRLLTESLRQVIDIGVR